jgi:hypothetical protein
MLSLSEITFLACRRDSADFSSDHVRLCKVLGGGWRPVSEEMMPIHADNAARTSRP